MRGEPRDRGGFELSLDVRELVSVALGLLVVLGLVFYLGVAVGKDLGRGAEPAPTSLDALDAIAEVKPEELTFPEVLTEPEVAEVPRAEEPRAEKPRGEEARKPAEVEAAAEKPQPPTEARRAEAAPQRPEPASERKQEAAPAAAKDSADGPLFVVQVASFPNKQEADAMVQSLRERNLAASVVEAEIPGRGIYYRVRVGRFSEREAAKRYQEDLLRETGLEGFVVAAGD